MRESHVECAFSTIMLLAQVLLQSVYYVPVFVVMGLLAWCAYLKIARLELDKSLRHIAPDVSREGADKSGRLRRMENLALIMWQLG